MGLHIAKPGSQIEAACGGNAARVTDDPNNPSINCPRCLEMWRGKPASELSLAMIHKSSARILANACWSCGKSDTYCDGRLQQEGRECCEVCGTTVHDAHTGEYADRNAVTGYVWHFDPDEVLGNPDCGHRWTPIPTGLRACSECGRIELIEWQPDSIVRRQASIADHYTHADE